MDNVVGRPPLERRYVAPSLTLRGQTFTWGARTLVMAIINATPDSFSGDGTRGDPGLAAVRALAFEKAGADLIDIGGESSRPGATPLGPREEAERVLPAVRAVRAVTELPISIDTYHASVAHEALDEGADLINDIHGLRHDAEMACVAAKHRAPVIAMHNQRGRPFHEVIADIREGFERTLCLAREAGVEPGQIILDPGFGFGWAPAQNLEMVRRLPELWDFDVPLLIGPSRKSTLGLLLDTPVTERIEATAAMVALAIAGGVDIVRVHDVAAMTRVVRVSDAVMRANWQGA